MHRNNAMSPSNKPSSIMYPRLDTLRPVDGITFRCRDLLRKFRSVVVHHSRYLDRARKGVTAHTDIVDFVPLVVRQSFVHLGVHKLILDLHVSVRNGDDVLGESEALELLSAADAVRKACADGVIDHGVLGYIRSGILTEGLVADREVDVLVDSIRDSVKSSACDGFGSVECNDRSSRHRGYTEAV